MVHLESRFRYDVSIIQISTDTIATTLRTDKFGHYFFKVDILSSYRIDVRKNGYEVVEPVIFQPELSPATITHILHTTPRPVHFVAHVFLVGLFRPFLVHPSKC
jgi:hypothetical protein